MAVDVELHLSVRRAWPARWLLRWRECLRQSW
jgi:hypothetical protein